MNKRGPNIEPCETPEVISSLPKYCKMTQSWFFVFDFEGNPILFLKQTKTNCKHLVSQKVSYDKQITAFDRLVRSASNTYYYQLLFPTIYNQVEAILWTIITFSKT